VTELLIERHVGCGCGPCARYRASWQRTLAVIRGLPEVAR
jgi:hypothetical protein